MHDECLPKFLDGPHCTLIFSGFSILSDRALLNEENVGKTPIGAYNLCLTIIIREFIFSSDFIYKSDSQNCI